MKNPRYANSAGGILIEQDSGVDLYVDNGSLYDAIVNGNYGVVDEYVEPDPRPEPIPQQVTMRQARLALLNAGLLADVKSFMGAIADPTQKEAAHIEWEYAQTVRRDNPLINAFAQAHPMTDAEVDALFVAAAEI